MTDIDEAPEPADGAFALAYGLGYDARLDELNRLYAEIAALKHDLDLQPLHDLVKSWCVLIRKWDGSDGNYDDALLLCVNQLGDAIAKIQSAGAVKS